MTRGLCGLTFLLTALAAAPARASCIPATESQHLKGADAVFVGRVLSVRFSDGSASFQVLSVRKGHIRRGSTTRVYATPYPSSVTIDWEPRKGQRWRLYVDRKGRRWITNDCYGTRKA